MRRIAYIAAIGAFLLPFPSIAAETDAGKEGYSFSIVGNGLDPCSAWTRARKTKTGPDAAWVLGYISALNFWFLPKDRAAARNLAEGANVEGVFSEIDAYCEAFPLKQVNDATQAVVTRLVTKWHAAHPALPAKPAPRKRAQRTAGEVPSR